MKISHYIFSLFAALMVLLVAGCTPDDGSMGSSSLTSADLQEGTAFTIEADASNPNLIHLTNKLSDYDAFWSHPGVGTGHSTGNNVDLKIAFQGKYPVVFGVRTPQGMIYSDTTWVDINTFCADFVNGDDWTYLAGGAGNSKTWVPDNGKYGMKQGFYSCFDPTAVYSDMKADEGKNNWYASGKTWWEASNADVGITDADLAQTMTFSLQGAAKLTVKDQNGNTTTGTFAFDPDSHSLSANGVEFAHGAWANGKSKSFSSNFYVFHLSENQLMIACKRDPALSGEGECWYVWNFVSKDYADNYHETVPTEPTLPTGWEDALTKQTNTNITWVLNADTPYDWFTLGGVRKNSYAKVSDYPAFVRPLTTLGDASSQITLDMNSKDNSYKVKVGGLTKVSGTYTLSDKGVYTFSNGLGSYALGGSGNWIKFSADGDNQLRVLSYDVNATSGKANNLWLGAKEKDDNGDTYQYLGYHFTAITYGDVTPLKAKLALFDTGWAFQYSDEVDLADDDELKANGEKQYTATINGSCDSPYGIYFDIENLLAVYPKATLTLNDVLVDGVSTGVDYNQDVFDRNSDGSQMTGDASTTARIYVLNPWNDTKTYTDKYKFTKTLSVVYTVKLNK
ncbi:MAG: hypothetical protein PUD15_05715 [Prevotella sp.]|nr:hypothetical protein [Prevotella sp.]